VFGAGRRRRTCIDPTAAAVIADGHVAEKISRVAGRKISYVDLTPAEFKKAILCAGAPDKENVICSG
jgi:hypothetical protein